MSRMIVVDVEALAFFPSMTTPLQRYEEVGAVCENNECENAGDWEQYDTDTVKTDEIGDYVRCYYCKMKIYLED